MMWILHPSLPPRFLHGAASLDVLHASIKDAPNDFLLLLSLPTQGALGLELPKTPILGTAGGGEHQPLSPLHYPGGQECQRWNQVPPTTARTGRSRANERGERGKNFHGAQSDVAGPKFSRFYKRSGRWPRAKRGFISSVAALETAGAAG